jgi:hypothetical protein
MRQNTTRLIPLTERDLQSLRQSPSSIRATLSTAKRFPCSISRMLESWNPAALSMLWKVSSD